MDADTIDKLKMVLRPLGEGKVNQVLAWMQREEQSRALISFCWDGKDPDKFFSLGEKSPLNENVIVFAMLHWEQRNCIVCFGAELFETDAGTAVAYHRTLVFNPSMVTGPVSAPGLYNELAMFMEADPAAPEGEEEQDDKDDGEQPRARQVTQ